MFLPGWSIWCVLLILRMSTCALEISGYDSHEVICSQGLSNCTMKDEIPLALGENDAAGVRNLEAFFKLCCKDRAPCTLCLVIDTEININLDKDMEDENHSGHEDEDYSEETRNPKASVTVCYNAATTMPTCKKVEFTINHAALTQQSLAQLSMVITEPAGVSFSSQVMVYSRHLSLSREVVAPSLDGVCSQELQERVEECQVPRLSSVINQEMSRLELRFAGRNKSLPSMCIQYEQNGICQRWNRPTVPLDLVTPCICFQVWDEDDQRSRRTLSCPYVNTNFLQRNVWQNVSVSVAQGEMNNYHTMLLWNLSAPCRLEGEVWPCHKENSCREMRGFRQQLENGTWRQNRKGQWENIGVFEDISLQLSPCVMVKVKGMEHELGPFCFNDTDRWRWTLLVVVVMLLVCLAGLIFSHFYSFVKKWVWSWHHGGFIEIGGKRHVVLLSPPDVDDGVSASVCRLASLLCKRGFSVSVDQWSRKEQCTLGPLPWLHSQLLETKSLGGRVVLVLSRTALEMAEEWTHPHKEAVKAEGEDKRLPKIWSPYSDVFMASLCLIQADKQLGRAGERFLLVEFDSHLSGDRRRPELLQGLPLFVLPAQTKAFMSELTVGEAGRGLGRRTRTRWKWSLRAKAAEGSDRQKASHCKHGGVEKNSETQLLKNP